MDQFYQNYYQQQMFQPTHFDQKPCIEANIPCEWTEGHIVPCGSVFGSLLDLVNHINMDHVGAVSNLENFCFWAGCKRAHTPFKAKYKLVNHLRIHTGERPFVCTHVTDGQVCGKSFARGENLKIHNRIHTGEKPFKCFQPDCEKVFSNSSDRKKHMNCHKKGIMLCPVEDCDRTYCHPSSLRKHLKTHGEDALKLKLPERICETTLKRKFEDDEPNFAKKQKLENSINSVDDSGDSRGSTPQPIPETLNLQNADLEYYANFGAAADLAAASAAWPQQAGFFYNPNMQANMEQFYQNVASYYPMNL
jgi:uncharacterized C2H2 Zn-finger protein